MNVTIWSLHSHIESRIHWTRDALASFELVECLRGFGHGYKETILNRPFLFDHKEDEPPTEPLDTADAWSFLTRDQILLQPTRIPLDDRTTNDKRYVVRPYNWVDFQIAGRVRPYFKQLARSRVWLAEDLCRDLRNRTDDELPYGDRRSRERIKFFQGGDEWAVYDRLLLPKAHGRGLQQVRADSQRCLSTATFMLFIPELWPGGPQFLSAFGMSGSATLLWAFLLKTQLAGVVEEFTLSRSCRFLMAELTYGGSPDDDAYQSPIDLHRLKRIAELWKVTEILNVAS